MTSKTIVINDITYSSTPDERIGSCQGCAFRDDDSGCAVADSIVDCSAENIIWKKIDQDAAEVGEMDNQIKEQPMTKTIVINDITYSSKLSGECGDRGCGRCAFRRDRRGCIGAQEDFDCVTLGIVWQEYKPAAPPVSEKTFTLADIGAAWMSTNIDTLADLVKALDKVTDPSISNILHSRQSSSKLG